MKRLWLLALVALTLACSDAEARRIVDEALDAEEAYDRASAEFIRDWEAVEAAFTVRGGALARNNYLDGKESETPAPILASGTYRRATESTDAYLEALSAYDAALEAVEDAGAWDLLEEVDAATPTPEPVPIAQNRLVERFGCTWIMDNYRVMSAAGRDTAILHVSNVMNLQDSGGYVSAGDAAAAIRDCEGR